MPKNNKYLDFIWVGFVHWTGILYYIICSVVCCKEEEMIVQKLNDCLRQLNENSEIIVHFLIMKKTKIMVQIW